MKIRVTLKDPDAFSDSVERDVFGIPLGPELTVEEIDWVRQKRCERARAALVKWVSDGEYVTIEFDTIAMTATVVERF